MNQQKALDPAKTPAVKMPQPQVGAQPVAGDSLPSRSAENPLSEREMDVARLLVTGANNGEIASELIISPHTVKVHLRNIYEKLGVNSRTEASMLLVSQGWIYVPGLETGVAASEEEAPPEPAPLEASSGAPFRWQPIYLLAALVLSLGVLLTPFFTRPAQSVLNLLSDDSMLAVGRPVIAEMPRWESRTPLSTARSRLALVAINDTFLYAIGGESAQGQPLAGVDVYDLRINEWTSGIPLPLALANMATTADATRILLAGGTTTDGEAGERLSDRLLVFTPDSQRWSEWGLLPLPLAGASLQLVGNDLYLLGGWDGQIARDEVWRIPADSGAGVVPTDWQVVTHLSRGRVFAGSAVVANELYVVGGYDGRQELADAAAYDTQSGEWRELPDLANSRGGVSLLYDGLALFAVGGGWSQPVDTIERFDPGTGLWSNFPSPIQGQWRHLGGAASTLGHLYLVGGWSGSYLDVHLRYQSSFRTFFPNTTKDGGTPATTP